MYTLHVVSHTHWDREWYLPFQQFRFRLVRLVEELLDILEGDPAYRHFMLDGQAVVLDDVLAVRPDLETDLRRHVSEGRILIGPWFALPDEFLASPEALLRNLLLGDRLCRAWGAKMEIGYIPDPFGHVSQLPQLLRGLGIETAVFARGVGDAPAEFRWAAPDGSEVLVCYLRDHYDNAAHLPTRERDAVQMLAQARDSLAPHAATSQLLLMQGTDHMRPRADLPRLLAAAAAHLPDRVVHSSLPAFVAAVRAELGEGGVASLPVRRGEMREPSRAHLLPGVLSTRMWIKQRNHTCQTLLERWAESFSALAAHLPGSSPESRSFKPFIDLAWRYLLENHPHDSICGCSVDSVHREMETRFDACEQIAGEVTQAALESLAAQVDTGAEGLAAVVVSNPSGMARTGRVTARVVPPLDPDGAALVGPDGAQVPFDVLGHSLGTETEMTLDRQTVAQMAAQVLADGGVVWGEWMVRGLQVWVVEGVGHVAVTVSRGRSPGAALPDAEVDRLQTLLADETLREFRVRIREDEALVVAFVARNVPPLGYATYRFVPAVVGGSGGEVPHDPPPDSRPVVENGFLRVEADPETGLLTVVDKETGLTLRGCHRLVDGGDRGDEYNYCRPEQDTQVEGPAAPPVIRRESSAWGQCLVVEMVYRVPEALDAADRSVRGQEVVEIPITVRATLTPGVRRVDFETVAENRARDHRLRVHFPVPLAVDRASAAGHWDVVDWSLDLPADTAEWAEQPVPTRPQRGWASVSDGKHGVTVANRGLPEVEVLRTEAGVEIALTLLRCVGWLSRSDLHCRRGHAGPALAVPEAQCPGRHTSRYALIPHAGDWRAALAEAEAFQSDLRAVATSIHPGVLPRALSFIRVEPAPLQVSAVRLPEEGEGLILRLWNVEDRPLQGTVRLWRPFARALRTDLAERSGGERVLARESDVVPLTVRGREVVTVRLLAD
jgi:alpha-mannosidase